MMQPSAVGSKRHRPYMRRNGCISHACIRRGAFFVGNTDGIHGRRRARRRPPSFHPPPRCRPWLPARKISRSRHRCRHSRPSPTSCSSRIARRLWRHGDTRPSLWSLGSLRLSRWSIVIGRNICLETHGRYLLSADLRILRSPRWRVTWRSGLAVL